ncbi:S-layer homology domain-containing protein [Bifidobacterium miconisargentati]|uniref:S-layer homology domain-containing protein n=1 Tax=Bifidobacterium miconisargentati TaxID=2834437 RepID=UPI001BDD248A|nr:S-layer homology domain-containing protein [Bifidobacterium miconisargentati]MBW3091151.1 S-layer homology domain-containing protein [Bifidobacterium miconisargentati]
MTGNNKVWRAPLAGLASLAMIATMGVAAGTANAVDGVNTPTYTVTFDLNGRGSLADANKTQKHTAGDKVTFGSTTKPTAPAGWTFTGWYTSDGVKFNPDTRLTADTTLYAHWGKDVKTVKFQKSSYLKFADTNQNGTADEQGATGDNVIKLAAGDKVADWEKPTDASATDGHILTGFTVAGKDWDSSVAPTSNVTVSTVLKKSQYVELAKGTKSGVDSFQVSGNQTDIEFAYGEDVPELPTAVYYVNGKGRKIVSSWAYSAYDTTADNGTRLWDGGAIPESAKDDKVADFIVLVPLVDESDSDAVQVTYEVAGSPDVQDFDGKKYYVAKGEAAPEPTVNTFGDAYEFSGWYTDSAYTNRYYGDGLTDFNNVLYGYLSLKNVTFDVTFDPDYDGSTPVVTKVANGAAAEWQTATRDGYVFQGWIDESYTPARFTTNADDFADNYGKISGPVYLKAAWLTTAQNEMKGLVELDTRAYTDASVKEYNKVVKSVTDDANLSTLYATSSAKPYDFQKAYAKLGEKAVAEWVKTLKAAQLKLVTKDQTFLDVFDGDNGTVATPHSAAIEFVAEQGIAKGYGDGTFKPTGSMYRQDYAAFLYRLAGSPEYTVNAADNIFTDVTPATPHYKEILWAAKQGIIKGFSDGTFRGTALVNRQDAAAFLYRAAGSPEFDPSTAAKQFSDVNESTPHYKEVLWAANTVVNTKYDGKSTAIVNGFSTGTFDGYATLLRQDGAAFLARTYFYINK